MADSPDTTPADEVPAPIRDINAWVDSLLQTIVCEPHRETAIREAIEDLPGFYRVQPSEFCPPGQILVLPPQGRPPTYNPPLEPRRDIIGFALTTPPNIPSRLIVGV